MNDTPGCYPLGWFMIVVGGPLDAVIRLVFSFAFGCGIGLVSLIVGLAQLNHHVTLRHTQIQIRRFTYNTWLNPGTSTCCPDPDGDQCPEEEPSSVAASEDQNHSSPRHSPPAYSDHYSDGLLPRDDQVQPPPPYTPGIGVGVVTVATAGIDMSLGTDPIWEAFFDRCAGEARNAITRQWITVTELTHCSEEVYAGLPAVALLQCLVEAASVSTNPDVQKAESSGLECMHLSGGVVVSWRSSSHPLCNHFFAASAGCYDELAALHPLREGELDCLVVLVLTNDPIRAAACANASAIGRVDSIAMRLRVIGKELSRIWQFRRRFDEMLTQVAQNQ